MFDTVKSRKSALGISMTEPNNPSSARRTRKHPRFILNYPVQLKFRSENAPQIVGATSHNISLGGVLLYASQPVPQGSKVEFLMTISQGATGESIRLKSTGRVVRIEHDSLGTGYEVAIEWKRRIHQVLRKIAAH
jgi:hypothetical protein